ncbi:hypothetical protein M9H77_14234 [Catharanthus roseus]|uniref:Uncharacterized protein n=1 Tax=Catharanthus roseus TaxID=4058 RepID=A0ACC0BMI8_CATRO|nr:hypothetical protein M9H77_14234 [Catharanthus roseus]
MGIEMKVCEETFKKVMRAMKVLDILTWMLDMGIGIHMKKKLELYSVGKNKDLHILEKPIGQKLPQCFLLFVAEALLCTLRPLLVSTRRTPLQVIGMLVPSVF